MKNQNKKIIALASVASLLLTAGIAFAQPAPSQPHQQHQEQQQIPQQSHQPNDEKHHQDRYAQNTHKNNQQKRYVTVKKNGKFVKIDCWKKQNTKLRVCKVR